MIHYHRLYILLIITTLKFNLHELNLAAVHTLKLNMRLIGSLLLLEINFKLENLKLILFSRRSQQNVVNTQFLRNE